MASDNRGYWSRSYALLTRDEGWVKPLLVLAAARMVPIVGSFGVDGYALEWARLTAWGVDSSPKQRGVDVGACIASGARAFVIALGYLLVLGIVRQAVGFVLGRTLGGLVSAVLGAFVGVLVIVAKLRGTIYQSIGAGYQVDRIWDMVKRDHRGLLSIVGLSLAMGAILTIAAAIPTAIVLVASMGSALVDVVEYGVYGYYDELELVMSLISAMGKALPALLVLGYLVGIGSSFVRLVEDTAVGLWMRQFDVRSWGESSDPLPGSPARPSDGQQSHQGYQQPAAQETPQPAPFAVPQPSPEPTAAPSDESAALRSLDTLDIPEPLVVAPEPEAAQPQDAAREVRTFSLVDEAEAEEDDGQDPLARAEEAIRAADLTADEDDAPAPFRFSLEDVDADLPRVEADETVTSVTPLTPAAADAPEATGEEAPAEE